MGYAYVHVLRKEPQVNECAHMAALSGAKAAYHWLRVPMTGSEGGGWWSHKKHNITWIFTCSAASSVAGLSLGAPRDQLYCSLVLHGVKGNLKSSSLVGTKEGESARVRQS
jgi:hypothetical protein